MCAGVAYGLRIEVIGSSRNLWGETGSHLALTHAQSVDVAARGKGKERRGKARRPEPAERLALPFAHRPQSQSRARPTSTRSRRALSSACSPPCLPGSRWTGSPYYWGFSTCDRFPAPSSNSAHIACCLSPRLFGGSRWLISVRSMPRAASSARAASLSRVGALAAVRARVNVPARSIQTVAQTNEVSAYIILQ
jgi:hypothetical protein